MHIELNQDQVAGIRKQVVQEIVDSLTNKTSTSLPNPGTYLSRYDAIVGGYIASVDGQGVDALLIPVDAKGQPVVLDGVEYGCYGTKIEGADSETDGAANTKAMAAAGSVLAKTMLEIEAALPAKAELVMVWANVRHLFAKVGFWSSTQYDSRRAWVQGFEHGYVDYWYKGNTYKAFPIRRVNALSL